MHHIEIYVSDLESSRKFYSFLLEKLNFKIYQEWEEGFSYKKDSFYIVFVQVRKKYLEAGYNRCNIGLNHLAFSCNDKDKFNEIRAKFIKDNITFLYNDKYPFAGGENHYALYVEDPDRIKVEIILEIS